MPERFQSLFLTSFVVVGSGLVYILMLISDIYDGDPASVGQMISFSCANISLNLWNISRYYIDVPDEESPVIMPSRMGLYKSACFIIAGILLFVMVITDWATESSLRQARGFYAFQFAVCVIYDIADISIRRKRSRKNHE